MSNCLRGFAKKSHAVWNLCSPSQHCLSILRPRCTPASLLSQLSYTYFFVSLDFLTDFPIAALLSLLQCPCKHHLFMISLHDQSINVLSLYLEQLCPIFHRGLITVKIVLNFCLTLCATSPATALESIWNMQHGCMPFTTWLLTC